jgi:hypothetical protein
MPADSMRKALTPKRGLESNDRPNSNWVERHGEGGRGRGRDRDRRAPGGLSRSFVVHSYGHLRRHGCHESELERLSQ